MPKFSRISRNLLLVSLISFLTVLWLGSRYLSDAHTQFSGAVQLQRSVTPETTLFEVAQSLDLEQATIQRLLISSVQRDQELEKLNSLAKNTQSLFDRAREEIISSRPKETEKNQYRYSDESIEILLADLNDKFKRKSLINSVITSQMYRPPEERDESIRMRLFDAYADLINATNNLRKRTLALPDENYRGILVDQDTKDAIWSIRNSISQTTTLIESFLLKTELSALDTHNTENLSLRIFQHDTHIRQSLADLTDMVQGRIITGVSATTITDLAGDYDENFSALLTKLKLSITDETTPAITLAEWQEVANTTKEKVRALTNTALSSTLTRADLIKSSAATSLLINALLVLLCVAMVYISFRVARKIQHQADHDDLTGLSNRRKFCEVLEDKMRKTDIPGQECLVLMNIDVDGFKTVNDSMGHAVGDKLLIQVAKRLKSVAHKDMEVSRMGGDEFAICYTTRSTSNPLRFSWELRENFEKLFSINESLVKLGVCIGYSIYPDDAKTMEKLQITSDFAIHSAKQSGNRAIQPYDCEIAAQFENRIAIENDLVLAISNNELELYYQPQFNLDLNKINAVEALIRWNHPTRGMVPPDQFIEIAEECGLMPAIGEWVTNEACRQAAVWNNVENLNIRVAVNVSVHQITQPDFVQKVLQHMQRHEISAEFLELELTESVVISDVDWIIQSLSQLKSHGLRIALDDFGTGYSSLSQLQSLPLDTLKIDRSFISKLDENSPGVKSVTATIASIADAYGLETVAEGIETVGQLNAVANLGINVAQGYYFSKPLPKEELVETVLSINHNLAEELNQKTA